LKRRVIVLIINIPFILLLVVVRILRPLIWIRFGYFLASRIGHFAFDVEYYLTEKKLGFHPNNTFDIFFYHYVIEKKSANDFFNLYIKRHIRVYKWSKYLFNINEILPGGKKHHLPPVMTRDSGSTDIKGLFSKVGTQLTFTKEENMAGSHFLESIGFEEDEKFVCLIVRDSAYLPLSLHKHNNYLFNYFFLVVSI
jgi:hypothetical protein